MSSTGSSTGSITVWIAALKRGDMDALEPLWKTYFQRLVALARTKLRNAPRRVADEEDVALSALHSFCRGAEQGRFPQLSDRNNLWPLLVLITSRKAIDQVQEARAKKRGGGKVRGESALLPPGDASGSGDGWQQVFAREPSPADAVVLAEGCEGLLDRLGDDKLRQIAILKMHGYADKEVAIKLTCGLRTVERKLERIREIWERE